MLELKHRGLHIPPLAFWKALRKVFSGRKLVRDRDGLLAFHDFPAQPWTHLPTTEIRRIVTVRLRHRRTMGSGTHHQGLAMVFRLPQLAERNGILPRVEFRRRSGGVPFLDAIDEANAVDDRLLPLSRRQFRSASWIKRNTIVRHA